MIVLLMEEMRVSTAHGDNQFPTAREELFMDFDLLLLRGVVAAALSTFHWNSLSHQGIDPF